MLTKAQTSREMVFPFFPQGARLTPFMRACALWATLEEHDKILDMACGSGALLSFLNDRYRLTLCGMCDSPEQARAVRQRLEDADVISARLEDIPWRGEIFHAVLLPVLLRGEEMRQALSEAYRVLRPGGQIVLAARLLPFRGEGELTSRETMRLMQEIGFREVSCRAAGLAGAVIGWKRKEMQA